MENFKETLSEIQKANNTIFSVEFIKKDGSVRTMTARLHVKKGVKGTGMAYNPIEKGLLPVCCLLYTSPSPRDKRQSRMPSSA